MTTPIDPMGAVKLLREALRGVIRVADRKTDEFDAARDAIAATASIEQPTREAVAWQRKWDADGEVPKKEKKANGRLGWPFKFKLLPITKGKICTDDVPLYAGTAPPLLPPAKESILQAMVDHDQALGLYDDVAPTDAQKLATLREGLHELGWCAEFGALAKEVLDGAAPLVPAQTGTLSAPVDERFGGYSDSKSHAGNGFGGGSGQYRIEPIGGGGSGDSSESGSGGPSDPNVRGGGSGNWKKP